MSAFNVVRFRVKPGQEAAFVDAHRDLAPAWPGLRRFALVQTGASSFCLIGEWQDMASIAAARPAMGAQLDRFRALLEDLGGGLGVTDPVSGEAVLEVQQVSAPTGP
ncbi:antibiotic biosynthesis monooxygenase family protein [Inhella gelatinilytica]|uniref:Antibiotic biosynthesis monooxygenase n=1 Tax=Inhella gelatinilytica TaxID=2795030 RepID=A0A931NE42_9BURK|nr:antibiotic biosynthesis monooxygenase family protein [Inhella gelatinilytica]MBH9552111.1 antibiotic biosynthesis monooxygenase [Inhella gelatinilytica]